MKASIQMRAKAPSSSSGLVRSSSSGSSVGGALAAAAAAARAAAAAAVAQQQQLQQQQQQQQHHHQQQQHQLQQQPASTARRAVLAAGLALLALPAAAPAPSRADDGGARQGAALEEYMALEAKGKLKDRRALDDFRARHGVRRLLDGRVQLRSRSGEWFTVRLDMEVAGALLLRDSKGAVYAIETEGLPQVDLSDDYVLLMLFADGSWQDQMQAIEYEDADNGGKVTQLTMTEQEFREFVGLLRGTDEDDGQGGGGKGGKKKK